MYLIEEKDINNDIDIYETEFPGSEVGVKTVLWWNPILQEWEEDYVITLDGEIQ